MPAFHRSRPRTAIALLIALFAMGVPNTQAQESATPSDPAASGDEDRVLATVNGQEIRYSAVAEIFADRPPEYADIPIEYLLDPILEQLIVGHLIQERIEKEDFLTRADVQRQIEFSTNRLVERLWAEAKVDEQLTEDLLRQAYDTMTFPEMEEVRARHILFSTEEEAVATLAELAAGGVFEDLAKERSIDLASGRNGGDLGYFLQEEMVEAFADAAFAMEIGTVSQAPVQTDFGWHIIRVEDKRMRPPPTYEEMRSQLENSLRQEFFGNLLNELKAEAEIHRFNPDGSEIPETP